VLDKEGKIVKDGPNPDPRAQMLFGQIESHPRDKVTQPEATIPRTTTPSSPGAPVTPGVSTASVQPTTPPSGTSVSGQIPQKTPTALAFDFTRGLAARRPTSDDGGQQEDGAQQAGGQPPTKLKAPPKPPGDPLIPS
jgi:hypothetical protein